MATTCIRPQPRLYGTATLNHLAHLRRLPQVIERLAKPSNVTLKMLRRCALSREGLEGSLLLVNDINCLLESGLAQLKVPSRDASNLPFLFVKGVNIELTYSCNLACSHCLQSPLRTSSLNNWIDEKTTLQALEQAQWLGLTKLGCNITGGETFMPNSPILEILNGTNKLGIPTRANTNAWWGNRKDIQIGKQQFSSDGELVKILSDCGLSRLALSLDNRYEQYPELLDRVIRVACLCEKNRLPYEFVSTEPNSTICTKASMAIKNTIGSTPRYIHITPMQIVDIGAAKPTTAIQPFMTHLDQLALQSPCGGAGFHKPYYLHIAPDGGIRSCLYAPAGGWIGNIYHQSLVDILNTASSNPVSKIFEHKRLDSFVAKYLIPWQHYYRGISHGCTASALIARLAEQIYGLETSQGHPPTSEQVTGIHKVLANGLGLEAMPSSEKESIML